MKYTIYPVCGSGAVGNHPLDADAWSGSSAFFFREIERRKALGQPVGGEISFFWKSLLALLNYSKNPAILRRRLYMDTRYRNALSRLLAAKIRNIDFAPDSLVIQLGSMFNIADAVPDRYALSSYNDGNFIMSLQSPYFPKEHISAKKIDAAIRFEKETLSRMRYVWTMSEYLRNSFINDYGLAPEKVFCIGAGINLTDEIIAEMTQAAEAKKHYDNAEILFIGVDFPRKGGPTLLKAFRKTQADLPQAKLHIIGPKSPPEGMDSLPGVTWHGFLNKDNPEDKARLTSLFQKASLFVMPSVYEPFGIAPLEAMLNKVPCLVSNRWALPEIVPEGRVGELVEPENVEMLAEKMTHLLKNPEILQQYGDQCQPWVLERFSWRKVVDRLEGFLES